MPVNDLYIYHHLGLGDHIICNAIIRHYSKIHSKVYLFVKPHNFISVQYMYRDLNNIEYIMGDDFFVENYIKENNIINLLKIGFDKLNRNIKFDLSFYNIVELDFEKRWSDFYIQRDLDKEKEIYDYYKIDEDYIFLHDDIDRGFPINIIKNLRIIKPEKGLSENIFLYRKIIENATEIHCIDSSFKLFIDSIEIKSNKLFFYLNRNQQYSLYSSSNKDWLEI